MHSALRSSLGWIGTTALLGALSLACPVHAEGEATASEVEAQGNCSYGSSDAIEEVIRECRKAIRGFPDDAWVVFRLADSLYEAKRYAEAQEHLLRVVDLANTKPSQITVDYLAPSALLHLAHINFLKDAHTAATEYALKASRTTLRPMEAKFAHEIIGLSGFNSGAYAETVTAYEYLAGEYPLRSGDFWRWGMSHMLLGEYSRAREILARGVRDHPNDQALAEWLALARLIDQGPEAAFVEVKRANAQIRQMNSQCIAVRYVAASMSEVLSRAESARMHYALLLKHYPNALQVQIEASCPHGSEFSDFTYLRMHAKSFETREQTQRIMDKMAEVYRQVPLKPRPSGFEKVAQAGEAYMRAREWVRAMDKYDTILTQAPWWPEGHYNMALILTAHYGLNTWAIREMEMYLKLAPAGKHAAAARARLAEWRQGMQQVIASGWKPSEVVPMLIGIVR